MTLTGKQRRHLRALAHELATHVQVGKEGVSMHVLAAVDNALMAHELIKVQLPQIDRDERTAMAEALERGTGSALVGTTGRIALLYRPHPTEPTIRLPK